MCKYYSVISLSALVVLAFFTTSCERGSGAPVPIPDVHIECSTGNCVGATGTHVASVVFTRSGCAPDQMNFEFIASGNANVSCVSGTCSGTVTTWGDKNQNLVTEILSNFYYICGWIDLNDSIVDNNDAFSHTSDTIVSGETLTITDWSATRQF